jgi:5'-deoxynucleotidase YfbR-like HD superfamily hydrolase
MTRRKAIDYTYTASGKRIYLPEIQPKDIDFHDICYSLARIYRFNGHSNITVARHSLALADWIHAETQNVEATLYALLHDMPEAYVMDVPVPMQRLMRPEWKNIERRIIAYILRRLGVKVSSTTKKLVHRFDKLIVQYEMNHSGTEMRYPLAVRLTPRQIQRLDCYYQWGTEDSELPVELLNRVELYLHRATE